MVTYCRLQNALQCTWYVLAPFDEVPTQKSTLSTCRCQYLAHKNWPSPGIFGYRFWYILLGVSYSISILSEPVRERKRLQQTPHSFHKTITALVLILEPIHRSQSRRRSWIRPESCPRCSFVQSLVSQSCLDDSPAASRKKYMDLSSAGLSPISACLLKYAVGSKQLAVSPAVRGTAAAKLAAELDPWRTNTIGIERKALGLTDSPGQYTLAISYTRVRKSRRGTAR